MEKRNAIRTVQCRRCGKVISFEKFAPVVWLSDAMGFKLWSVLAGESDEPHCPVCRERLGFKQSLGVLLQEPPTLMYAAGDFLEKDATLLPALFAHLQIEETNRFVLADSHDELRKLIIERLKEYGKLFEESNGAAEIGEMNEYMMKNWRKYTPEKFVAADFLIKTGIIKVFPATGNQQPRATHEAEAGFWRLQALSWVSLCAAWSQLETLTAESDFETDLSRYLFPEAVNKQAVAEFLSLADHLVAAPQISRSFRYCLEAVRATLHWISREPNPHLDSWTQILVDFETKLAPPDCPDRESLLLLRLGEDRVQATVEYRAVFDALLPFFYRQISITAESLEAVAARLGFPEMFRDLPLTFKAQPETPLDFNGLRHIFDESWRLAAELFGEVDLSEEDRLLALLTQLSAAFRGAISGTDLINLADYVASKLPPDARTQAEINVWLGSVLYQMREPRLFLERIGGEISPEEESLSKEIRAKLWTERANALRTARRFESAKKIYLKIAGLFDERDDSKNARTARRNLAIILRETGAPDEAMAMLGALLPFAGGEERLELLENLGTTALALGDSFAAAKFLEEALELAQGFLAQHRARLQTALSQITILTNPAAVSEELLSRPLPPVSDPVAVLHEAAAWINFIGNGGAGGEELEERLREVTNRLLEFSGYFASTGDVQSALFVSHMLAFLADWFGLPDAADYWRAFYVHAVKSGTGEPPAALLALARHYYDSGEIEEGRYFMTRVPNALVAELGGVLRIDLAVNALHDLEWQFSDIARVLFGQTAAQFEDFRLLADVRRDAVRRAARGRRTAKKKIGAEAQPIFIAPTDENIAALTGTDSFAVLEWIRIKGDIAFLLTIVENGDTNDEKRKIESRWLNPPEINLRQLHERILSKLNNWTLARPGSPFDYDEWQKFENWFAGEVGAEITRAGHLAIIEGESLAGFPWHVAAASFGTCSYVSSWSALLVLLQSPPENEFGGALGTISVPSFDENPAILSAMETSFERAQRFAERNHIAFDAASGTDCNEQRMRELMERNEWLKIVCHGFVSQAEREVALMIAAENELPLKLSHVAASVEGRRHRFGWRSIERLEKTPRLVFSSACSTAYAHIEGTGGDRLGLFAPLGEKGTRALVAPGWDVEAEIILPILDDALESSILNKQPLAAALRQACVSAERNNRPRRLAWALRLEGDWR